MPRSVTDSLATILFQQTIKGRLKQNWFCTKLRSSIMLFVVILLFTSCYPSNGAKILGVLVSEFKSHYLNIRNVADELASRGHEVSLVVPSVLPFTPSPSFKHSTYKFPFGKDHLVNVFVPKSHNLSFFEGAEDNQRWMDYFFISCRALLSHVQQHKDELKTFDLMFCDSPPECGAIISEILRLPRIDIKPAGFGMRFYPALSVVSYIPWIFSSNSNQMSFFERVENLFYHTLISTSSWSYYARYEGLTVEFGEGGERSFQEAINTVEMTIIMGHFALEYPQPILPATKLVGPLTIKPTNPLPEDLEQFINGAGDKGIILFALGTLGDVVLTKQQVDMLAEAFGRLEQRIIWRLKGYIPDDLSSNIKVLSWIPQNDLLAHNGTKAFISHTGHNSLYEAAFYGVPLVCVPIFADQLSNCVQAQSVGIAIGIDIKTVTGDEVYHSIRRILEEPSFKGNATRISRLLRDSPRTSLQQAADWIEYVHRHKGAKHLRPEVYNLYWYQYYLLDVVAFLLSALFAFCIVMRLLFRLLCKMFTKRAKGYKISKQE